LSLAVTGGLAATVDPEEMISRLRASVKPTNGEGAKFVAQWRDALALATRLGICRPNPDNSREMTIE